MLFSLNIKLFGLMQMKHVIKNPFFFLNSVISPGQEADTDSQTESF